ncbi:MAG TPA: hypothetical protein VGE97_07260 [Nitrososphaera sp.]|jgi:hypothetical protein
MLQNQQRALEERRREENLREQRWRRLYVSKGEPEVVPGSILAVVLKNWCKRYLRDRPVSTGKGVSGGIYNFTGPVQYLSHESGIHVRRVSGLCNGEFPFVSLTQAEQILMAIDREYMLKTGEIPVVPSPNWPLEKWIAYMSERGCI